MRELPSSSSNRKWFERMRNDGETERVSWKELSFREKNDVLKSFALLFYLLPATTNGLSIAIEKAYKHFSSISKESQLSGTPFEIEGIEATRITDEKGVKYEFKIPERLQRMIEDVEKIQLGTKSPTVYRDWKVTIEYARPSESHAIEDHKPAKPRIPRPNFPLSKNEKDPFEPR